MTSWAGSESTADGQRVREREEVEEAGWFRWRGLGGGRWLRCWWLHCDSPCCHQRDRGPWVALSIPTWEAWKWRGHAVIIYSPQLLTLDSELITAKGKSDWSWRVPESVTLISVRCLQQEVREEELASVGFCSGFFPCVCLYVCVFVRFISGRAQLNDWLNRDSRWHVVGLLMGQDVACITIKY